MQNWGRVGWKDIRILQRWVTAVARSISNIFHVGSNGTERSAKRVFHNYSSYACILSVLKVLPKSHKPTRPDGNPQTRPVVGAYSCMTSRASEALCDVIGAC